MLRLIASVESSSCGQDVSKIPSIANDLGRYNSRLTAEIISLISYLKHVPDFLSGGSRVHRIDVIAFIAIKSDGWRLPEI